MRQGMSRARRQPQRGQNELGFGNFFFVVQPLSYGRRKRLECVLMHKYPRAKLSFSWMAQYARMHSHPWLLLKHIQVGCV